MSRYGPQSVTPNLSGPLLADALSSIGTAIGERRRRRQVEADRAVRDREQAAADYGRGIRTGTPPSEDVRIGLPDVNAGLAGVPSSADLSRELRGGDSIHNTLEAPPAPANNPLTTLPSNADLSRSLRGAPSGTSAPATAAPADNPMAEYFPGLSDAILNQSIPQRPASVLNDTPAADARDNAIVHPGAWDAATRSFGGGPLQMATAERHANAGRTITLPSSSPRYAPLDESHYLDTFHTPEAERDRDRQSQAELAAELRRMDIAARGNQALTLEDRRQQGRVNLRDRINSSQILGILTRGDVQATNDAARDTRRGDQQAAHDARVTTRQEALGQRPITATQREHNAITAADGVIAASNGSYDDALDWLRNTDEGQAAAGAGLQPRHLYAALGKYQNLTTSQAISLERGTMGQEPVGAVGSVRTTRDIVTGKGKPGSTPSKPAGSTDPLRRPPAAPAATPAPSTPPAAVAAPAGPAAPAKDPSARARELQAQGKSREDILRIMKGEGFNVIDTGRKP
jgi:hypothetical protein